MKRLLLVLAISFSAFAGSGGDSLVFPTSVTALADGDTFWVKSQWKPLVDTLLSWGNGRIGNINLADDALFDQRKIDSTQTLATDWIYNYTKKLWQWLTGTPTLRSPRGITVQMNDTTTNQGTFTVYTDSTKLIFRLGEDTIRTCLPTAIDSAITTGNDSIWVFKSFGSTLGTADSLTALLGIRSSASIYGDSLISAKGIRATNTVRGDSLLSDKGTRVTNTLKADSIYSVKGIKLTSLNSSDSVITKGIRATASIRGDSLLSDKGARIVTTLSADSVFSTKGMKSTTLDASDSVRAKAIRTTSSIRGDSLLSDKGIRGLSLSLNGTDASALGAVILNYDNAGNMESRAGQFGLATRYGIDVTDGFEIREITDTYATRFLIADDGAVTVTKQLSADSLYSTKGIKSTTLDASDSVRALAIRTTASIRGDSLLSDKGIRSVASAGIGGTLGVGRPVSTIKIDVHDSASSANITTIQTKTINAMTTNAIVLKGSDASSNEEAGGFRLEPDSGLNINGTGNFSAYQVYLKQNGNVGIGKQSPTVKFDCNGDGTFTGNVGIDTLATAAKLHVNGYTMLGDVSPAFKLKLICAPAADDTTLIETGIGHNQIFNINVQNHTYASGYGSYFSPNDPWGASANVSWWCGAKSVLNPPSDTNDTLWVKTADTNLGDGDSVNVLIWYRE